MTAEPVSPSRSSVELTPRGQDVAVWAPAVAAAPWTDLDELVTRLGCESVPTRLVVLAAHPDDETIGAGRLVAAWAREVGPVGAVLATAGEACTDHVGPRLAGIAGRRMAEWEAALRALGVGERVDLGLPDGGLGAADGLLDAGIAAVLDASAGREPVVLAAPWRHDPHPDHAAVGRAAYRASVRQGIPLVFYPVWMTYWSDPDGTEAATADLWRLRTSTEDERVRDEALAAFATQLQPLAPGWAPVVPPAMLAHHRHQLLLTDREAA